MTVELYWTVGFTLAGLVVGLVVGFCICALLVVEDDEQDLPDTDEDWP